MSRDTSAAPPGKWYSTLLRYDLPASLVVFLVALPLSIGIAVASGAPVMAGLIAAVIGGVVAGAIGGSLLQVSGPAAGLTVVVAGLIQNFGWKTTCFITVGAGILQILFGLSRIARAALAIAPVVVHAMLAGIGITIALQQIHVALGGRSGSSALDNLSRLPSQLTALHWRDLLLSATVVAILLCWRFTPKRVQAIPAPLVAVVAATLLSLPLAVSRIELSGSLLDAIALPALPDGRWAAIGAGILTVALIASVESLLSAVAVDKMHTGRRTNFDRELIGQGSANVASGMLGGLPITGVIVRSATNVRAGARSQASAIMHGLWVLLFTAALAGLVQQVPKSVLAGLLIVVGIQLVKLAHVKLAHRTGDLAVYVITAAGVVFTNLLEGVIIGLVLAFVLLLWRVVRVSIEAGPEQTGTDAAAWRMAIEGTCTFLALPRLTKVTATIPEGVPVTVEITVDFLDHAVYDALTAWARQHESTGGSVKFVELGTVRMSAAELGPPARGPVRSQVEPVLRPRVSDRGSSVRSAVSAYHRHHAPLVRPHLNELRTERHPKTLFLTCADSRVIPNVITHSAPGDLYTVRNMGNIVPADGADSSVDSALEFALGKFAVDSVVVCGHSGCTSMEALASGHELAGGWLRYGRPALEQLRAGHPVATAAAAAGYGEIDQLAMVNVAVQLETLRVHPAVLAAGGVRLTGLFLDVRTAQVLEITGTGIAEIGERELAPAP